VAVGWPSCAGDWRVRKCATVYMCRWIIIRLIQERTGSEFYLSRRSVIVWPRQRVGASCAVDRGSRIRWSEVKAGL
jgi:hypothetical protein